MSPPDYTAICLQINAGVPVRLIAKELAMKTKDLRKQLKDHKLNLSLQSEVKKRVV